MAHIGRIDLNLFVVLDAIYTESSITRASETLNLTQPAVSHALARLREVVGDPLFVREGHVMVPTPLTRELIGPVRKALREIGGALSQLNHFDPLTSTKHFKIGMRHVVESATFPHFAAQICAMAPHVEISAVHHTRDDLQSELATGELDIAIDILLPNVQNVFFKSLGGGGLSVAARRDHPVVKGALDLETYLSCDHVLASSRRSGVGLEDEELQKIGRERRIRARCQHFWTASQLVASSDMLLTVPSSFAHVLNGVLGNQVLPFPMDVSTLEIYAYWHASADQNPANLWLRQKIGEVFSTSLDDASPKAVGDVSRRSGIRGLVR